MCVWGIAFDEYLFYVGSYIASVPLTEMGFVGTHIC